MNRRVPHLVVLVGANLAFDTGELGFDFRGSTFDGGGGMILPGTEAGASEKESAQ